MQFGARSLTDLGAISGTQAADASRATILLYESNLTILRMLTFNLEMEGLAVVPAGSLAEVQARLGDAELDLVLLCWGEQSGDCLALCRAIRSSPHSAEVPVVIVSGPRDENERIAAYDAGADDFVIKPYSQPELFARIRAILRRTAPQVSNRVIRIGGIDCDVDNGIVRRDGTEIRLSAIEFRILRYLMENPGKVRTREQIRNAVWGRDTRVELRAVDVRITRLRRRLNDGGRPDVIRTVRAIGYALGERAPRLSPGTVEARANRVQEPSMPIVSPSSSPVGGMPTLP